jgi:hypothetical protein
VKESAQMPNIQKLTLETIVREDKLAEWCQRLPDFKDFLTNFFTTCAPYPRATNYINYASDIRMYGAENPLFVVYEPMLLDAFDEIAIDMKEMN